MKLLTFTALAAGAVLALTGCSTEPPAPPVWSQPIQRPDFRPDPDPVYGEQTLNERNNLVKQLGQPAAITNPDGSVLVDFTVTNIQPAKCDTGPEHTAENGRFLLIDLAINTYDDPDDTLPAISFGQGWEFVAERDGTTVDAVTTAAFSCSYELDDPTPQLKANRKYTAQVVVDVPDIPGALTWTTGWTAGNAGWEWHVKPS